MVFENSVGYLSYYLVVSLVKAVAAIVSQAKLDACE